MKVERVYVSDQVERFEISGGKKSIIIQGNRPLLKNKKSKNKRIDWKLYEGSYTNPAALAMVILELEKYLKNSEGDKDPFVLQK